MITFDLTKLNETIEIMSHDQLTPALSKKYFVLKVHESLKNTIDIKNGYLFFCDLNEINRLNELYNRAKVNDYIRGIFHRLKEMFSFDNNVLFSRVGDEFLIYSPECTISQKFQIDKQLEAINSIMGRSISSGSVSIHSEEGHHDVSTLLSIADTEMQENKRKIRLENLKKIYPLNDDFINGVLSSLFDKLRLNIKNLSESQLKELPNKIIEVFKDYSESSKTNNATFDTSLSEYINILTETQQEYSQIRNADNMPYDDETISKIALLKYLSTFNNDIYSHDFFSKFHNELLDDRHTTLTLIDTSFLKEINDTISHEFADLEILALSDAVSAAFKEVSSSFIVRKGAGEFYVVSPKLTPEQLQKICNNLSEYNSEHKLHAHILVDENDTSIKNTLFKIIEDNENALDVEKSRYKYSNLEMCGNTIAKMIAILDIHRPYDEQLIVKLKENISKVISEIVNSKGFTKDEDLPIIQ